jgi:hypothetical protein
MSLPHHHKKNASCAILAALSMALAGCGRADEPKAPSQPYALPTLTGRVDITPPKTGGYAPPPQIDADALFDAVVRCYPAPSWFRGELAAIARAGTSAPTDLTDATATGGKSYLGLVAKIPLYAPVEADRERERENARRQQIALAVAKLNEAATNRAVGLRKRALYLSLESRAALRVRHGVADIAEQAGYLEKLAAQEEAIAKANADITAARLTLRGMCQEDKAGAIDRMIGDMLEAAR